MLGSRLKPKSGSFNVKQRVFEAEILSAGRRGPIGTGFDANDAILEFFGNWFGSCLTEPLT
jgi:hypothetical protein